HRINEVVPERMQQMELAIANQDFDTFAEITMADSNQFHAVCLDTYPPIFYLNDISRGVIRLVTVYNQLFLDKPAGAGGAKGYKVAYTFDAGPNAVLYMPKENVPEVLGLINHFFPASLSSEAANKEYYGRASRFLDQIPHKELQEITQQIKLAPWPANSLRRLISTTVGDGPRLLSTTNDEQSLLTDDNLPKQ
ncbi:diphosphomevalonate decarboxylase, partial [Kappamyces sp. JEL0680]